MLRSTSLSARFSNPPVYDLRTVDGMLDWAADVEEKYGWNAALPILINAMSLEPEQSEH